MKKTIIKKIVGITATTALTAASISNAFACVAPKNHVFIQTDNGTVKILHEPIKITDGPISNEEFEKLEKREIFTDGTISLKGPYDGLKEIILKHIKGNSIFDNIPENVSTNSQEDYSEIYSEAELKYILEVVILTNAEREKNGIAPLKINYSLCKAAQKHAEDMAKNNYLSHTSKDGRTMSDRIEEYTKNYFCIGENIAAGQKTPEDVVKSWMNSSGHKANILNEKYTEIGVGCSNNYWIQDFLG